MYTLHHAQQFVEVKESVSVWCVRETKTDKG